MSRPALVTVGIPTYNRADTVVRAVRSALDQDHRALEVVVSDDGSTDRTRAVLADLADREPRLRVIAQRSNIGHARNFQAVLEAATGEYFMWLSDDDWIDRRYVARCVLTLGERPDHVLVAGLARYYVDDVHEVDERPTVLNASRPGLRVLKYLSRVNVNGALFGVVRRADLLELGFRDQVGGDWLLMGELAAKGRVRIIDDVNIHRSLVGLSSDEQGLARSFGMSELMARQHHLLVAANFAREIATAPAYRRIPAPGRMLCALAAGLLIVVRFPGHAAARRLLSAVGLERVERVAISWARRRD